MGTILVTGMGKMNIIHHEEVPFQLVENRVVTIQNFMFHKEVDIRMDSEIKGQESVRAIIKVLQEAKPKDIIRFHLAGVGGEVETVWNLINNVRASKGTVYMIVEAPVYSGHAYLALSSDHLIMRPFSSLMLHTSSAYGEDCSTSEGTDRTVSNVYHCQMFLDTHLRLVTKFLSEIDPKIVTAEEKVRILTGYDYYLTADDYTRRTHP